MFPKVVQVIPYEDYCVYVYFEDGKIVSYDVSKLLEKGVFSCLKDKKLYLKSCTVMNDTLAWDISGSRDASKCLDIDPFTLYELPQIAERIA